MSDLIFRRNDGWWNLLLLAICLANGGCLFVAAGAAGAGTYAYCRGRFEDTYPGDFNTVWQAPHVSLNNLGMPLLTETRDASSGTIDTQTGTREKVRVYVTAEHKKIPADPPRTKVSVRVATFGDEPVSRRVLQQVEGALAAVPVQPQ